MASPQLTQQEHRMPAPVRRAAYAVAVEGLLLCAAAVLVVVLIFTQEELDLTLALVEAAVALGAGVGLIAMARGLLRGNPGVRAPVAVIQVLAMPVGWTLLGGGQVVLGLVVLALVATVLWQLFASEEAREALARR